jgi:hypothetical protein
MIEGIRPIEDFFALSGNYSDSHDLLKAVRVTPDLSHGRALWAPVVFATEDGREIADTILEPQLARSPQ